MEQTQKDKRTRGANVAIVQGYLSMSHRPELWHEASIKDAIKPMLDEYRRAEEKS